MSTLRREPNAFWRYSLRTYRAAEVQAACLALQEQCAADVNILLLCCWFGQSGRSLDRRALRHAMAAVARWQDEIVRPLRLVRHALKTAPRTVPSGWAADLRRRIGAVELDLEYVEQRLLANAAQALPPRARLQPPRMAAGASLARYLVLLPAPPRTSTSLLLARLLDACWPQVDAPGRG